MHDITKPRALPIGRGCNKKVVTTLATYLRDDTKIINSNEVKTYVYKCPSPQCNFRNNEIVFPIASGWTNPFNHLKKCLSQNDLRHFAEYYWSKADALEAGSSIVDHFPVIKEDFAPEESNDVMKWIELIVLKSLPINIVEDPTYRRFHDSDKRHGSVKIKQVMFKLCEYIEKIIGGEMKSAGRGTIMHDGWSKFGTHFLALLACYAVKIKVKGSSNGTDQLMNETKIVLLSVAPVLRPVLVDHMDHDMDDPNPVAVTQNATAILHHLQTILKDRFGVDWSWVMAIHSDRASVCVCTCKLGKKPMIGCKNHAWDHDVSSMFSTHEHLSSCQEECHQCQRGLKQSVKKRTLLAEFTSLNPTIKNETRWTGMYTCMRKQEQMSPTLQNIEDSGRVAVEFNSANAMFNHNVLQPAFNDTLRNYNIDLKEINKCTTRLQTRLQQFNISNQIMNITTAVVNGSTNSDIEIGRVHSGQESIKRADPHFENGIFKLQEGRKGDLNYEEEKACQHLIVNAVEGTNRADTTHTTVEGYLESLNKKPHVEEGDYGDVSIFLGSCAEVERVWSFAKYILTNTQASMTPVLFETIIFLKYNWSYVTVQMVQKALAEVKRDNFNERRKKMDIQQEQMHIENDS